MLSVFLNKFLFYPFYQFICSLTQVLVQFGFFSNTRSLLRYLESFVSVYIPSFWFLLCVTVILLSFFNNRRIR
jgi:hypothetical protein